ncbi:amino acid synthesis family protein [Pseudooceanicola sp. C21-150M6]|uniref:amino acid synthesis family protein n=1 Tax=Pseudooceanicola sp. C21-150M6 TaxID=3434355 RepID=UPI003D7F9B0F
MPELSIRSYLSQTEIIHAEAGQPVMPPLVRVVVGAVIATPYPGALPGDLGPLAEIGAELGTELTRRALGLMRLIGGPGTDPQGYGKAALIGTNGELELGAAILHPRFGASVRALIPGATEIMPSTQKRGQPGTSIDIPLHGLSDMWSFDHFDAATFVAPDAPLPDEGLILIALASGGRPRARTRPVT